MSTGWIISLVVAVVAICAGLAAMGFRGRITTVGVDLGTTFSVVGINKNGKVIIIEDKLGRNIFPSVVSYRDGGDIVTGYAAVAEQSKRPENTIYNAKRFLGRSLKDEQMRQYADQHPFNVVESTLSNFSQVLKSLLRVTADYLGHDQTNRAVIAVPAKFDSVQRQATAEAYRQAGLKVIRVIEEPTAAAVAYRLHKKSNIHHILVYDFGGGTLDVSLLYVARGSVQVYATDGDETLGGSDLDICLYQNIKDKVHGHTGVDIDSLSTRDYSGLLSSSDSNSCSESRSGLSEGDTCLVASVHSKAEAVKKRLTNGTDTEFSCVMPDSYHNGEIVRFSVSRKSDFESGCSELFRRALVPVTRLLEDLSMTKEDIDEVVLVGGSTRVPFVKQQLREYFGKELNDHIDPDVTVAYGAASIMD